MFVDFNLQFEFAVFMAFEPERLQEAQTGHEILICVFYFQSASTVCYTCLILLHISLQYSLLIAELGFMYNSTQ